MVIDTSAIVAILQAETGFRQLLEAIEAADSRRMSMTTFVEASIVMAARYGSEGLSNLDRFLRVAEIELSPVDLEQGHGARSAFERFGKGRHRARLNLGDCFSYALASARGEPLLCKGDDFAHTDLELAVSG